MSDDYEPEPESKPESKLESKTDSDSHPNYIYDIFDRKNSEFDTRKLLDLSEYFNIMHGNNKFSITREVDDEIVLSVNIELKAQFLHTVENYLFSVDVLDVYMKDLALNLKLKLNNIIEHILTTKDSEQKSLDDAYAKKNNDIDQTQKEELKNIQNHNDKVSEDIKRLHHENLKSISEEYEEYDENSNFGINMEIIRQQKMIYKERQQQKLQQASDKYHRELQQLDQRYQQNLQNHNQKFINIWQMHHQTYSFDVQMLNQGCQIEIQNSRKSYDDAIKILNEQEIIIKETYEKSWIL